MTSALNASRPPQLLCDTHPHASCTRRLNHSLQFHAFVDAQKPNKMSFDLVLIVRDALRVDMIH